MSTSDERLSAVETTQAVQGQRLNDHDVVLIDIRHHLRELIGRVDKFQTRLIVVALLVFAGTKNGGALANHVAQLFQ